MFKFQLLSKKQQESNSREKVEEEEGGFFFFYTRLGKEIEFNLCRGELEGCIQLLTREP